MFVYSDAGRSNSKHPNETNDCTVRALALAVNKKYDVIFEFLRFYGKNNNTKFALGSLLDKFNGVFQFYLTRVTFPTIKNQKRMKVENFCQTWNKGTWLVFTAGHVACVKDGVLMDTTDSILNKCLYRAYKFEKTKT